MKYFMRFTGSALLLGSLGASMACGKTAGEAVRPNDPSATAALQNGALACKRGSYAEPLVVDLPADQRVDFEAGMKEGVALVSYDCKSIRLLKDCRLSGDYKFAAVSRKEQVMRLENGDEIRANLPFAQGKIGGEVTTSSKLDVALVMVGKRSTAAEVARPALQGSQCGEATHFVRAAVVGAFAVNTATSGKASAAAEIFLASSSGSSSSAKQSGQKDGDIAACASSKSSDTAPPDQCQSAIRFELIPIADKVASSDKKDAAKGKDSIDDPCPEGFRMTGGKCTPASAQGPKLCNRNDAEDCKKQCAAGNLPSCHNYANLAVVSFGKDVPSAQAKTDEGIAIEYWKKACDGDVGEACYELGSQLLTGGGGRPVNAAQGESVLVKGCNLGNSDACYEVAHYSLKDSGPLPKDAIKGMTFTERACKLGDKIACSELGEYYFTGKHVAKDPKVGDRLMSQFCAQGDAAACFEHGQHLLGIFNPDWAPEAPVVGIPDAKTRGRAALEKACKVQWSKRDEACVQLARVKLDAGEPGSRAEVEKLCNPAKLKDADETACQYLGMAYLEGRDGAQDLDKGVTLLKHAADGEVSALAAHKLETGEGRVPKDTDRAKKLYQYACKEHHLQDACAAASRL
jgi:hypothetical protein